MFWLVESEASPVAQARVGGLTDNTSKECGQQETNKRHGQLREVADARHLLI